MPETTRRLLIVEDEAIVALDLRSRLEQLGYGIVGTAATAQQACDLAAQFEPDLVLMDIHLQGASDGVEAAAEIRRRQGIPVVFLTAYTDPATLARAKVAEPYGYIVKPFDEADLRTAVEIALYKGQADLAVRRSREDMLAVLDAQRHGTLLVDAGGHVTFLSHAARRMLGVEGETAYGQHWRDLLPMPTEASEQLSAMMDRPGDRRRKVVATLEPGTGGAWQVELEVEDDRQDARRKIIFLYDVTDLHQLRRQLDESARFEGIVGRSDAIRRVTRLIEDLAQVDSTVLIAGESGTGKELVARAIHQRSRRREQPFLPLNCGGLGEELAASQLFGHRKGAFTGAAEDRAGMFEAAGAGTLFLDEIGELPLRIQTTLLRVLEENAVLRLGETKLRPVRARILVASNRDLTTEVAQGRFRPDLLYRIRVARVHLPPLRQRRDDIPLLVRTFLAELRAVTGKTVESVSDEALAALMQFPWPGNVRELKNTLEFALIRARGSVLQSDDLPDEIRPSSPCPVGESPGAAEDEKQRILAALDRAGGNRTAAAGLLGIGRATLYRRMAQLGIHEAE